MLTCPSAEAAQYGLVLQQTLFCEIFGFHARKSQFDKSPRGSLNRDAPQQAPVVRVLVQKHPVRNNRAPSFTVPPVNISTKGVSLAR